MSEPASLTTQLSSNVLLKPGYIKMSRFLSGINSINHYFQKKGYELVKLEPRALIEKCIARTRLDDFGGDDFHYPHSCLWDCLQ